ncbi:hypothetical protein GCM10009775_07030 [Microbacterium aoyamense]|uniref:Flagellar protein FliT n=1 Tax=Microbacterium aoyamense TaxID=344166 RepID=A0ABP5APW8_9MICO|nr:hypothetical protein [Microbacterium aoyamense]
MSENLAAWVRLLDQFESALDAADGHTPPQALETPTEPIPEEIRERAEAILARQQLMIGGVLAARAQVARQLNALRRVPSRQTDAPAYLDVEG